MSTKIYDAYKFDKKYNIDELCAIMGKWKIDLTVLAQKEYAKLFFKEFMYYYDMSVVYSKLNSTKIKDLFLLNQQKGNKELTLIFQDVLDKNYFRLALNVDDFISKNIKEAEVRPTILNDDYDFRCHLQVIPIVDKLLFLYFGNREFLKYIEHKRIVSDYHYQNQTDKPDNITYKKWEQRELDWELALAPDYIPSKHGCSFSLVSEMDMGLFVNPYIRKKSNLQYIHFPTKIERAQEILGTFSDYPNPPDKDSSGHDWMVYMRTDAYKLWKQNKLNSILQMLDEVSANDGFKLIFNN